MKSQFKIISVFLLFLALTAQISSAGVQINVGINTGSDFSVLAGYGRWVDVPRYGRCWTPWHVTATWRPFTRGEWIWTDAGWTWASYEPYGWMVYHYGNWHYEPAYG